MLFNVLIHIYQLANEKITVVRLKFTIRKNPVQEPAMLFYFLDLKSKPPIGQTIME